MNYYIYPMTKITSLHRIIFFICLIILISCSETFDDSCPIRYFDLEVKNTTDTKVEFNYSLVKTCWALSSGIGSGIEQIEAHSTLSQKIGERDPQGFNVSLTENDNIIHHGGLIEYPLENTISLIITYDGQWYYIDSEKEYDLLEQATIHYTSSIETDGCGWLIETSGKFYSPVQFDENQEFQYYREEGLKVIIKYNILTDNLICSLESAIYPKIEILVIRKF